LSRSCNRSLPHLKDWVNPYGIVANGRWRAWACRGRTWRGTIVDSVLFVGILYDHAFLLFLTKRIRDLASRRKYFKEALSKAEKDHKKDSKDVNVRKGYRRVFGCPSV
jgi:hypothetical protein